MQNVLGTFVQELQQSMNQILEVQKGLVLGTIQVNQAVTGLQPMFNTLSSIANDAGLVRAQSMFTAFSNFSQQVSAIHSTFLFPALLTELIEKMQVMIEELPKQKIDTNLELESLTTTVNTLSKMGRQLAFRYKITVEFEESYELKNIRAFMVLKELRPYVTFLSVDPDLTKNQNANLSRGLHMEVLSTADPRTLHSIAGSVLEVTAVKILIETKKNPSVYLTTTFSNIAIDQRVTDFVS